jgi:DUF1365 family protein
VNSRLYEGHITHERKRPVRNGFRYSVWMLYVDLDELAELDRTVRGFGHNRRAWSSFHDGDHGPRDGSPLQPWIEGLLGKAEIDLEGGSVRLLSFARGPIGKFYPVTFWYCFHQDGTLRAVLAEVQNTFGGHHNYLLHRGGEPMGFKEDLHTTKVFHVSPFISMDARYRFRFTEPADKIAVTLYDDVEGSLLLIAAVSLSARPFDTATMAELNHRYFSVPLKAWLLIHFQAIRLALKRVRFYHDLGAPKEDTSLDPQNTVPHG